VLLTSSEEFRVCRIEGRIQGEGVVERREAVVPAPPPSTS